MTARDAGGITARALAVYTAVSSIGYFTSAIEVVGVATRYHDWGSVGIHIAELVMGGALFVIAALVLWARSAAFWSSDQTATSQMQAKEWQRLALFVIGVYLLLLAVPEGLYVFFATLQTNLSLPRANADDMWRTGGHIVIGAVLIATNWPKPSLSDFEEAPPSPTGSA